MHALAPMYWQHWIKRVVRARAAFAAIVHRSVRNRLSALVADALAPT
jgi:hypothetical protein